MSVPRLSIVIPAYNVERFIAEAVASALAQTLADIEVVVVDDGSTDRTPEILAGFDDPRLRVVRQENGGLSAARNAGIRAARAELIGFLDGDDRWRPEKAERHVALMRAEPAVGISFSHSAWIEADGAQTGRVLFSALASPSLADMAVRNLVGNGSTPVVRAACFREAGPFDESLRSCEDWEMWVRILRETRRTARLVPEALTEYRLNAASLSMNFDGFLRNAEVAAAKLIRESPSLRPSLFRLGLAITYRVAATKALRAGDRRSALRYLGKALARSPSIPLRDPRFLSSVAFLAAPKAAMDLANRLAARVFARGALSGPA